jgi:hypothetical protein
MQRFGILMLVAVGACASNAKPETSGSATGSVLSTGTCSGERIAIVDNRSRTDIDVFVGNASKVLGVVRVGKREEVVLPDGASRVQYKASDPLVEGVPPSVNVRYACR